MKPKPEKPQQHLGDQTPTLSATPPLPRLLKEGNGSRWRVSLGLLFESLVVTMLLLVPLLQTEQLIPMVVGAEPPIAIPRGDPAGSVAVEHPGEPIPTTAPKEFLLTLPAHIPTTVATGAAQQVLQAGPGVELGNGLLRWGVPEGVDNGALPGFGQIPVGPVITPPPQQEPVLVGGRIRPPKLLHRVDPTYPGVAKRANIQGEVVLKAVLGTDGRVQQIQVLSGHGALVPAAVQAVSQWVYEPTYLNDRPVPVLLEVRVEFRLRR